MCGLLIGLADRGVHRQPAGVGVLAVRLEHHLPRHLGDEFAVSGNWLALALPDDDWRGLCLLVLHICQKTEIVHPAQNIQLPAPGPLGVGDRVECRGRLGQAGEHGRLRRGDVLERLPEIDLGRRGEAVRALAQKDLIEIKLQNLVFRQVCLDLPRQQHFPQLARDRLLAREKEVAGHLHGDGASTLLGAAGEVARGCPEDADVVHAAVGIEALVFGGQDRFLQDVRHLGDAHHCAPLLAELAEELALGGDDAQRDLRAVVGQRVERGQRRVEERQHERAQQAADHDQADRDGADVQEPALQHRWIKRTVPGRNVA